MWKSIRVSILLTVLVIVAGNAWLEQHRARSWRDSLWVGIFPVVADGRPATRAYVEALRPETFAALEPFFAREAARFGLPLAAPFRVELYPVLAASPPLAPGPAEAGPLAMVWWSLRMRWFAWRYGSAPGRPAPHVRVFVLYHDPALNPTLPHSLGLRKGQIGLVHAFAGEALGGSNAIVIAHELLHTVGATDKYDPATDAPVFPQGFADPEQRPRYPQQRAEIMAGRRALSAHAQDMPDSLDDCVVGPVTAVEIGWLKR
jgi:hypothetical protein